MRKGLWLGALMVGVGVAGAAPGALAGPAEDYAAVRTDWQRDKVVTACRFTVAQLEAARSALTPEDGYTDLPSAIQDEIRRHRSGGCPGGGGLTGRPVLSAVRFTPTVFAVSPRATALAAARKGSTLRYSLSKAAGVRIVVEHAERAGRGVRWLQAGGLVRRGRAGQNSVAFSGRIGRRALRTGRYRARLVATDSQRRRSAERRASFRVVSSQ